MARGDTVPQTSIATALGLRRVTIQAYLAPSEALPLLPPGWEEVQPGSATPVGWTPRDKAAQPIPQSGSADRAARARAIRLERLRNEKEMRESR
ncbi:hypothetical protein CcrBL47_gp537 [Caulobacter phage BL47]|nr:hypothetical protein CcrBL47_gp021 [Caulobacter phage BL47]UTU09819.1 hypothetical protein CcrBL47_gp537 [Caulobacter phage BL47]